MGITTCLLVGVGIIFLWCLQGWFKGTWRKTSSVNVVMVTHNHAEVLEGIARGLGNLAAAYDLEIQLVLVDQGSGDGTREVMRLLGQEYAWIMPVETMEEINSLRQAFYCELPPGVNSVEILQVYERLFALIKQQTQVQQLRQNQIYIKHIYSKKQPI